MVHKKEMVAMLLAGGQGSRLGVLTVSKAKPVVAFGGKYKIIDFTMSNCINSGIDTVGVLTQYQPLQLNKHIGIGVPWDLDRNSGGVTTLAPHMKSDKGYWYSGTANAIYRNLDYLNSYNPEYVLILSGDHIYKMDYSKLLDYHKQQECDATIAVLEVPIEDASRFGIMNTDENDKVYEFEEKPENPKSNLASMGIYIFTWAKLKEYLIKSEEINDESDFGKHIIPMMLNDGCPMYAYRFNDYWRDVGTIESYWMANMDLIKLVPEFNLYEGFWKIYTDVEHQAPLFTGSEANVNKSLITGGCEIYGTVVNSILGTDCIVEEGAIVRDSIIMQRCHIKKGAVLDRCIVDEGSVIGEYSVLGEGDNTPNEQKPHIYNTGITVVQEESVVPNNVKIGKNCVVAGISSFEHYQDGTLPSGGSVILDTGEGR